MQPEPQEPPAQRDGADLLAMALWLRVHVLERLTPKQRDFTATAARLLTAGRALTPKQSQWLRDLHAQHATRKEHCPMNATIRRTRPRGIAPWTPRPASRALVQDVQAVLADYSEHLPLTIRQVFYRLVATQGFEKTESGYSRLCETVNRARRAGLIVKEKRKL